LSSIALLALGLLASGEARAESKQEYQNRIRLMLDFAVRTNEYVRQHLGDRGLSAYSHAMAERNAIEAERMTPPGKYAVIHPHVLLVLENIERALFFSARGDMARYRHHQKVVRKELHILEAMAERERLELYVWSRHF
jgi:hypothetical protein